MSVEIVECPRHEEHERRIKVLEKDLSGFGKRITDLDKEYAVTKERMMLSMQDLSKLPDTLNKMNESMVLMQRSLDENNCKTDNFSGDVKDLRDEVKQLNMKVENEVKFLNEKVEDINEEGKFNIRKYIRDNWVALLVGIAGLIVFSSSFLK